MSKFRVSYSQETWMEKWDADTSWNQSDSKQQHELGQVVAYAEE